MSRGGAFTRRDEPSGSRMILAFLGLLIVIGVFWVLTSDRFDKENPANSVADVGPQTLSTLIKMGKPGVLELYTPDCPWCTKLGPELKKLEDANKDRLFVVKMNAEKYPAEAARYQVQAVPTIVYFDASGEVAEIATGYADVAAMTSKLKELKLIP